MCVFFLHFTLNLLMKSIRNSSIRLLNSSIIIFVVSNISAPIVEIYVKNSIGCNLNKRLFCEWNKWTEDWTEEGILWFSVSSTSDKWVNHKQWTSIRVKIFFFFEKKKSICPPCVFGHTLWGLLWCCSLGKMEILLHIQAYSFQ